MRKVRTLLGRANGNEVVQVIENDLPNVAWKITRFDIVPLNAQRLEGAAQQYGTLRLCTDMRGLTAQAGPGLDDLDWDSRQVLAISSMGTGYARISSLDPENFVVQDLFVQNCTNNGAYYHIEMELYTISSDEQIIYQLKQIGQDVE